MDKENLFKAIRREDVVLWAGAGFSLYAGYPSGQKLADLLFNDLSSTEKQSVDSSAYLPKLADQIVSIRNGSRNKLNKIIQDIYYKNPRSISVHEKLVSIPHINTIITTNYDQLFEMAYKDKIYKILDKENIPHIDKDKVSLFKIHGDLSRPSSIIITDKDFRGFFSKNDKNIWSLIEGILMTKTIMFVGYGLEDPNVLSVFERILDNLGDNMKEAYFVSPSLSQLKINEFARKNIYYIKSTGEDLVNEIFEDLKKNSIPDLETGIVSGDVTKKFLDVLGLGASFKIHNNGFKIDSIFNKNGLTNYKIEFKVKPESAVNEQLSNLKKGLTFDRVEIDREDLVSFDQLIEGLNVPLDAQKFWFAPAPVKQWVIDIVFADGLRIEEAKVELYVSRTEYKVVLYHNDIKWYVVGKKNSKSKKGLRGVRFTMEHINDYYNSVNEEIENYTIMKNFSKGVNFNCFVDGEMVYQSYLNSEKSGDSMADEMLLYFNDIKLIEKEFNIVFKKIRISDGCYNDVNKIGNILRQNSVTLPFKGNLEAVLNDDVIKNGIIYNKNKDHFICYNNIINDKFCIMGREFNIQYSEFNTIKDGRCSYDLDKNTICFRSKSGKINVQYSYPPRNIFEDENSLSIR